MRSQDGAGRATRTNPSGPTDRSEIDRRIEALEAERKAAGYKTASCGNF